MDLTEENMVNQTWLQELQAIKGYSPTRCAEPWRTALACAVPM